MTGATDIRSQTPIGHDEAMAMTAVENARFTELLSSLHDGDWHKSTDCARWDVRGVVCHVVGLAEMVASLREAFHQFRVGRPLTEEVGGHHFIDGVNELQVRERYDRTDAELRARWAQASAKSLRRRTKLPKVIRNLKVVEMPEPIVKVHIGYLSDIGLTRDVWMHRVDISHALGRPFEVDPAYDGRLINDMVAEWARTFDGPLDLTLTGPTGGHFVSGDNGERVEVDAVEFCRIVSGRVEGHGVLAHPLPL